MAHQHFYSRVPSRVSMYNKRDGFDTFAHSAGINRDFILGELSVMYRDKLEIHSPAKLRWGEIPRVYSQAMLPSGALAQTVISYLPKDFTGERSAYLAHTLLPSGEELDAMFKNNAFCAFNPDMFVGDVSVFDLTARDAVANPAMSDRAYTPADLADSRVVMAAYNPDMMKGLIFSVVMAIMGEGREVYFRLPYADSQASDKALEIVNAIISILPYSLRQKLSFVTYVSDANSYDGFILKCVGKDCPAIAPDKGVFYDFAAGVISAQTEKYEQYHGYASFLYSLFNYSKIRDDFHSFIAGIEETYPQLEWSMEKFIDIMYLFWQGSGFYYESSVITDDESLCRLFDIYAGYRDGISENYRVQMYKPLGRYLNEQIAIPDGVFTRLSRLYATECVEAKAVALDILLGLIHVDVMRERLFAFISRNYAGEIPSVKEVINADLGRVFYGGFLQNRILSHFEINFAREPVSTRDMIIDKLLLSIRTPEVQGRIVYFIDRYFRLFTTTQRIKVCTTCLEMIPECDELSVTLVDLINRRLSQDPDSARMLQVGLTQSLGYSLQAGDWRLSAILLDKTGFCEEIALSYIIGNNTGIDILLALLADMPAHKRIQKLIIAAKTVQGLTEDAYIQLLSSFNGRPVRVVPSTMYEIIAADDEAVLSLSEKSLVGIRESVIYPAILHTFLDVFKTNLGTEGIEALGRYIEANPSLANTAEYSVVLNYLSMVELAQGGDTEGAFKLAAGMPEDAEVRKNIAEYFKSHYSSTDNDTAECTYQLLLQYFGRGEFDFENIYSEYQSKYELAYREAGAIMSRIESFDRCGAADAAKLLIECASEICSVSSTLADLVCDENSGFRKSLASFVKLYGIGAGRFFKKCCAEAYFAISDITEELIEDRNASIGSVEDAVNLIFRRK